MTWRRRMALIAIVTVVSGCAFNPANYAVPGSGIGGETYSLNIDFASVLNLPTGAKVMSNGVEIGRMSAIDVHRDHVTVRAEIKTSVSLPADTRAELRQTSVLGDIFIALMPSANSRLQALSDGATIPLANTDTGPQLEDVMSNMAMFINGGSMTRLQDTLEQLNKTLPADPLDTSRLSAELAQNVRDVASSTAALGDIANNLNDSALSIIDNTDIWQAFFSQSGMTRFLNVTPLVDGAFNLTGNLGVLLKALSWLDLRLPTINAAVSKLVPILREPSPSALQLWGNAGNTLDLFQNKIVPFLTNGPSVNVSALSLSGTDSRDAANDLKVLLHMIGMAR
jgi:phospholipid/cholesterol/gamma-HCH transport system substrate-binding protein